MTSKTETPESPWGSPAQLPRLQVRPRRRSFLLMLLLPAVFITLLVFGMVTGYLEKWLWMRELKYTEIFWTLFSDPVDHVHYGIHRLFSCTFGSTFAWPSVFSPPRARQFDPAKHDVITC